MLLVVVGAAAALYAVTTRDGDDPIEPLVVRVEARTIEPEAEMFAQPSSSIAPYGGLAGWVDVFDFSPPYAGPSPSVTPATVAEMADAGVRTVMLQAARIDDRTPGGLEDPWLLAEMLMRSHQQGVAVVGWYLPKWDTQGDDLERVLAMADFDVMGHRFDGVALDIEWITDDLAPSERSARLVNLSQAVRTQLGSEVVVGAIVPPPVQTEVVNPNFWPGFPWSQIAPLYDVWLPMTYWSFRSESSGYRDAYRYTTESVQRLRANIGQVFAPIHPIGGIGAVDGVDDDPDPGEPLATIGDLEPFVQALADTSSIGGSLYDWNATEPAAMAVMTELFATGAGSTLPDVTGG